MTEGYGNDVVNVTIQGSGPYGFRLSGGDGEPMAIIKLRRQGKAHQAGLHEGDTVLGINGFSCQTMSHSAAMGLLESAVHSVELLIFRGRAGDLNSAYAETASRLRPLPPGAAPPPRVLPPPPSAETGALVIDQPSYMRPYDERFIVDDSASAAPIQNGHVDDGGSSSSKKVEWKPVNIPSSAPPQQPWASPLDSGVAHAPITTPSDAPSATGWSVGVWKNAPPKSPVRWTPNQPPPAAAAADENDSATQNFRVTSAPSTDSKRPWMWQPQVTFQVTTVAAVPEPSQDWQAVPAQSTTPAYDEYDCGTEQQQQAVQRPRGDEENGVPKWALPLRSDYDWKKSYPWLLEEQVVFAEDDEWEYGYASDGTLIKRKKKIFADSSFYDEPEHKYPTIEEQIKMARRVAQSLTAATNVKARGQRMFLRRREKADRWIVSELPPPNMATLLRHGLITVTGERVVRPSSRGVPDVVDNVESDLYYSPAPWLRPVSGGRKGGVTPEPVKTPTSGARLPWKTNFDPSSSDAAVFRAPSPPPSPPPGQLHKWKPYGSSASAPDVSSGGSVKENLTKKFGASGAAAFTLSKELRQMKGKGGKMFAKRRAQAAEEDRRDELAETLRARHARKVGGFTSGDEDWTDSAQTAFGKVEVETVSNGNIQDHPVAGTPSRLLELIERTRATSPGRHWTASTVVVERQAVKDPSAYGNFSADIKSRGNFRPVRFRAPTGGLNVGFVTAQSAAEDLPQEGISDF